MEFEPGNFPYDMPLPKGANRVRKKCTELEKTYYKAKELLSGKAEEGEIGKVDAICDHPNCRVRFYLASQRYSSNGQIRFGATFPRQRSGGNVMCEMKRQSKG